MTDDPENAEKAKESIRVPRKEENGLQQVRRERIPGELTVLENPTRYIKKVTHYTVYNQQYILNNTQTQLTGQPEQLVQRTYS